uniref:Uncharacterized protein n=1 Tax=Chlamydomonas leiostraca TaxID=1034604 RepID=A0A7S0S397_9CHLO
MSKELGEGYLGPLADACKSLGRLEMCSTSVDGRGLCALMRGLPSLAHLGVHSVCAPMPDNGGAPLDAPPTFASLSLGLLAPTCELDVRVAARLPLAQLTETLELHSLTLVIGQSLDGQEAAAELAAAAHNLATACTTLRLRDCSLKLVCHGRMRGHGRGLLGAPLLQGLAPFAPHVRNLAIQGPGAGPDGLCLGGEELWTLAELWEPYGGLRELSVTGCDLERSFWSVICEALVSLRVLELGAACSGAVGATDLAHFCMHMPSTLELRAAGLAQQQQAMTNMALVTLQALEALAFQ